MLSRFFSKKTEEKNEEKELLSIFETDILNRACRTSFDKAKSINNSIQKKITDFRVVPIKGVAMDSISPSSVKVNMQSQNSLDDGLLSWYCDQGFIGHQSCAFLAQNWLVAKACLMPAKDAVRNGYELSINDGSDVNPKILDEIHDLDKKYKIRQNLREFDTKRRVFGIRVAMFKVDGIDYEKPFNIDGVGKGKYKGISQIDPYWMTPEFSYDGTSDPTSINFYEPEYWVIGSQRVHRSHLVIIKGDDVSDVLKPTYLYGGIPVPQKIAERVYAAERTANEAPMLTMTKRLNLYKMNLSKGISNQADLERKLANWNLLRDNHGVKIIGQDEELSQLDTSLTDVDTTTMTQYQLVSAASDVPATKLLGTSPKGFNATGEHETKSYHEMLESVQEDITPLADRHYELLVKSEITPKHGKDFKLSINWRPVDSPSAQELADINLKKAQTATNYVQAGAVDGQDVRNKLISDEDSGYIGMEEDAPEMPDIFGNEIDV